MSTTLKERLNRGRLPLALVALEGGRPVGTVSLKIREVETRPELEHWLGTLYVPESSRGKGIGAMLIEAALQEAAKHDICDLYLYTRQGRTERWYARLGWQVFESLVYHDRPAVIMTRQIPGARPETV